MQTVLGFAFPSLRLEGCARGFLRFGRRETRKAVYAALAITVCIIAASSAAAACDTANIEGYPPEPAAQCAEAEMTVEVGGMTPCHGDLQRMASVGANAYASNGNPAAAEYVGPMGGFFDAPLRDQSPAGVCAVSCIKLPKGAEIIDTRASTTTADAKSMRVRRVISTAREEVVASDAPYVSRIIVATSSIGPLVCMAVANLHNRTPDQRFDFYAYYVNSSEWPAGPQ